MQKGMIITCPKHDDATSYLTFFSNDIIREAANKFLSIKKIGDRQLNLNEFSKILEKLDYKLLVLNGHGISDSIFGYKENAIIKLGKNDGLIKERLVYARSCDAGTVLGKECMKKTKNGCFIGYNMPFIFYMDSKWTTNPHNDCVAKLFLEPSNLVPISIIKGHSALEAHENSRKQILKEMSRLMKNKQEQETPFYLEALWNNYAGQVIFGNKDACL